MLVLQIDDTVAPSQVFDQLVRRATARSCRSGTDLAVLAAGLEDGALARLGRPFDQSAARIWRRSRLAAWATDGSRFVDVEHELFVAVRRRHLVAVIGPEAVRSALRTWMERAPRPAIGRIRVGAMNAALLAGGEAKTMWLRNTRSRSATRPDAKALSGVDLDAALDPIGDGSFALSAVRIAIPDHDQRTAFTGTVGTTPRKSRVWSGPTADALEFFSAVGEVLEMIQETVDSGAARQPRRGVRRLRVQLPGRRATPGI
jgi:hypothetical protein